MTSIEVKVAGTLPQATLTGALTSGMVGVPVVFSFGHEWDGLSRTAVFEADGVAKDRELIGTNETTVPYEVLTVPGKTLKIGVEGRKPDGTIVYPSVLYPVGYIRKGANAANDPGRDPSPTVYDDIMAAIKSGQLQGPPGPHGPEGPAGPQGPAYELTEEDKAELAGDVLQELTGGITLKDRQTGADYAIYMRGGALTIEERTARAGTAGSMTMTDRTTGETYRIYVEAGNLTMEELGE